MTFHRFALLAGVLLIMNLVGWLSDAISWLDRQGGFTQTIVATLVLGAGGVLWTAIGWVWRRASTGWLNRRQAAIERRQRLEPKPKIGLMDVAVREAKAFTDHTACLKGLADAATKFSQKASLVKANIDGAGRSGKAGAKEKAMNGATSILRQYGTDVGRGVKELRRINDELEGCWSSRMYWHDKRGTAKDMFAAAANVRSLKTSATETADVFRGHPEKLDGWRGWNDPMDAAVDHYVEASERLVTAIEEFNMTCESVLVFYRQRTGVRGMARKIARGILGFKPRSA